MARFELGTSPVPSRYATNWAFLAWITRIKIELLFCIYATEYYITLIFCFFVRNIFEITTFLERIKPAQSYQQKNYQNSDKIFRYLYRFSNCVALKILCGKFPGICPASCTKIFCLEISQIFWKNWRVQNSQIFVRKFLRTQILIDMVQPWRFWFWLNLITCFDG